MRAVVVHEFGPAENAILEEVADPVPGPGEVLVEIYATAVNFVDLLLIGGRHQARPQIPYIPGKGPAGIVRALGEGVSGLALGERVLAMCEPGGGYAEMLTIPATQCHKLPESLPFAEAAGMALVYDTAWFALRERARMEKGETALILGASGGVGLAAVQLVKAFGGNALAGIANPYKEQLVRDAGADHVIRLDRENIHDDLRDQVHAVTEGRGADVVVDPLGDRFFNASLRALAWCGRLVIVGFAAGGISSVKANYLLVRNIEVSGLQIGDYRKRRPDKTARCFKEIFALFEAGKIKPLPIETRSIEEVQEALAALKNRDVSGRLVLVQDR